MDWATGAVFFKKGNDAGINIDDAVSFSSFLFHIPDISRYFNDLTSFRLLVQTCRCNFFYAYPLPAVDMALGIFSPHLLTILLRF